MGSGAAPRGGEPLWAVRGVLPAAPDPGMVASYIVVRRNNEAPVIRRGFMRSKGNRHLCGLHLRRQPA